MAEAAVAPKGFEHFLEITESFKAAGASAADGNSKNMQINPFLEAMTMFLRIFDAFSNPFFSDVVKKDVVGNIKKLGEAAARTNGNTLEEVIDKEISDPKLLKLIKNESGVGANAGTVALLWMKRTMQFVCGLLQLLVEDTSVSLSSASRKSYSKTLRYCHNIITRGVFDTGLRFAPSRESFYKNLAGNSDVDVSTIDGALKDFMEVFAPQLEGIVAMYKAKDLEPYIK